MARKDRGNPLTLLYDIATLLPWWAGVLLAVSFYLLFNHLASIPLPPNTGQPADISAQITGSLWRGFSNLAQYFAPTALGLGAIASLVKRYRARQLFNGVATQQTTISGLGWHEFERLIGEVFRQKGYSVVERGGAGGDDGVDVVLRKDGQKFLVQCKHWRKGKVGVSVVRELLGSIVAEGAQGGFVVASDNFTAQAESFAANNNIQLIGGAQLKRLIHNAQNSVPIPDTLKTEITSEPRVASAATQCPRCGSSMVRRVARRGANAGNEFWGCSRYPGCRGVVNV